MNECTFQLLPNEWMWAQPYLIFLLVADFVLKLVAMWKAGQRNQLAWFICLGVFNTVCILPVIYLVMHREYRHDHRDHTHHLTPEEKKLKNKSDLIHEE